jgi:predicted ATPase
MVFAECEESLTSLHASIAHTLEKHFPERVAREPEVIAQHFLEARQIENALSYLMKSGARAIERSANVEAMRHLTRGLEGVGSLPESASRDRLELALQIAIGTPAVSNSPKRMRVPEVARHRVIRNHRKALPRR